MIAKITGVFMNKILGVSLLSFMFIAINNIQASFDYRESFEGREWDFLWYELHEKCNNTSILRDIKNIGIVAAFGIVPVTTLLLRIRSKQPDIYYSITNPSFDSVLSHRAFGSILLSRAYELILSHIAGLGLLGGLVYVCKSDIKTFEKRQLNALKIFISNWTENKKYTPKCFYSSCDQLYALYLDKDETLQFNESLKQLLNVMNQALVKRFPKEYKRNHPRETARWTRKNVEKFILFWFLRDMVK